MQDLADSAPRAFSLNVTNQQWSQHGKSTARNHRNRSTTEGVARREETLCKRLTSGKINVILKYSEVINYDW